jgi:hypothetical protein
MRRLLMRALCGFFMLSLLPAAFPADQSAKTSPPAKTDQKQQDQKTLITVTYDISDIVAKVATWHPGGRSAALQRLSASLVEDFADLDPELARKLLGKDAVFSIQLLNEKTLEIRADKKTQKDLADYFSLVRHLLDGAVEVDCRLYEVDRKIVDAEIARKMNRHPGSATVFVRPDTEEFEKELLEKQDGKMKPDEPIRMGTSSLKRSKAVVQNGARGAIFSWRTAVPYEKRPALGNLANTRRNFTAWLTFPGVVYGEAPGRETAVVFPGFSFDMRPVISSDRRKMQIQLTQHVTQIVAWKKDKLRTWLPNQEMKEIDLEVPVLQESTFTSNISSLDGQPILALVQGQMPRAQARDRVLILAISPIIRIEEEERQILQGKKHFTEADAIRLAEQFIIENGYTDLPAMKDKTKLSHESIDYSDPDERLKLRFNSLERKAYGIGKVDLRENSWTIVFRYNAKNNRNGRTDYDQYVKTVGRALTMKADGSDIRMTHQDYYLKNVKVIKSGDK